MNTEAIADVVWFLLFAAEFYARQTLNRFRSRRCTCTPRGKYGREGHTYRCPISPRNLRRSA